MIDVDSLKILLEKYGIDYEKVVKNNDRVLERGNEKDIEDIVKYLINDLGVNPKSIEKAPSILYASVYAIKKNVEFFKSQDFDFSDIESSLHVLGTSPWRLEETYDYVRDNYGISYIQAITSILKVDVDRIKEIEKLGLDKGITLSAAISSLSLSDIRRNIQICRSNDVEVVSSVFRKSPEELQSIVSVCKNNGVEVTGSVFLKNALELERIISICHDNGILISNTVFLRSAREVEDIIALCREEDIELTGSIFKKKPEELKKIISICKKNGIEVTGTVCLKEAREVEEIIKVCRDNNVKVTASVFQKSAAEIEKIILVCRANGIAITGSVFRRDAEEIEKIVSVCRKYGVEIVGSAFKQSATEIEKIIRVCLANGIEITGNVFRQSAREVEDIIALCQTNGIEMTGSIFMKRPRQLEMSIDFIKSNYDDSYLKPLIVTKEVTQLRGVFSYLEECGVLETVKKSASILNLSLDEIRERKKFIDSTGEKMLLSNGRFNSTFGLSRKNYKEKVKVYKSVEVK